MADSYSFAVNYPGRPDYDLQLNVSLRSTSGNSKQWNWSLYALNPLRRTSTWFSTPRPWSVTIEGQSFSGSAALDFRAGQASILLGSGFTQYFAHNSDGNLYINTAWSHTTSPELFGNAATSGGFQANRIPKAPGAPPTPTFVSATSSVLNFTIAQPSDNGGSTILDYYLQLATDAGFTNIVEERTSGATNQTWTDLTAFTDYYMRYRARNAVGSGPYSSARQAKTLVGVPGTPGTPVPSNLAPTSVTLSWAAPASNGGGTITTYRIQRATNSTFTAGLTEFTTSGALSRDFTDLAPSASYWFRVRAENSAGAGAWSTAIEVVTVSGAYYSNGTSWIPVGIFVSDGVNWDAVELEVSVGANWVKAI